MNVVEQKASQTTKYAIYISEQIPPEWRVWFEGLTITNLYDDGCILSGPVADQAALHGLLAKVRDLNLTLLSVTRIEPQQPETKLEHEE